MMRVKAACVLAVLGIVFLLPGRSLEAIDRSIVWDWDLGDGNYDDPAMWDLDVVPCNAGAVEFLVTIPDPALTGAAAYRVLYTDPLTDCTIKTLALEANATLELNHPTRPAGSGFIVLGLARINGTIELVNAEFTIEGPAEIAGTIDASNAGFSALDPASLFLGDRASVYGAKGSQIVLAASAYSSKGLYADYRCDFFECNAHTIDHNLFSAADEGTFIDLHNLLSIDAGFNDNSGNGDNDSNRHHISAAKSAVIDLSGLVETRAPVNNNDVLVFDVNDPGSEIRLTSLTTLGTSGSGQTWFLLGEGSEQSLPALQAARWVTFDLKANSQVEIGTGLTELNDLRITALGGARFIGGGTESAYSSKNIYADYRCDFFECNAHTIDHNLFSAADEGTFIDLHNLLSIDAGFNDNSGNGDNDSNRHHISAANGATIDLSGVQNAISPVNGNDYLVFEVEGGGGIDLSSLRSVATAGSGAVRFDLSDRGVAQLGNTTFSAPTSISLSEGSEFRAGSTSVMSRTTLAVDASTAEFEDIHASDGEGIAITLSGANSRLEVSGSLALNGASSLVVSEGSFLSIGEDFLYANTEEEEIALGKSVVHFNGRPLQLLEVGGVDLDIEVGFLTNDNFGFGELILGEEGSPTTLQLIDAVDNGNRAGGDTEALYLFGMEDRDGLRIRRGSTLVIGSLSVYARVGGQIVRLQDLFTGDEVIVPFDEGFVRRTVQLDCVPSLSRIRPDSGGNFGPVTVQIRGNGFCDGVEAWLERDGEVIAEGFGTVPLESYLIETTFNLADREPGTADVVVRNLGGDPVKLEDAFTIEGSGGARVRITKTGSTPVPGRTIHYFIRVDNVGNVNATNLLVSDVLDRNVTLIETDPPPEVDLAAAAATGVIPWRIGSLPPNQSVVLSYQGRLAATGVANGSTLCTPTCEKGQLDLSGIGACLDRVIADLPLECQDPTCTDCLTDCVTKARNGDIFGALECIRQCSGCLDNCIDTVQANFCTCLETFGCVSPEPPPVVQGPVDPNEKRVLGGGLSALSSTVEGQIEAYIQADDRIVFPIGIYNEGTIEAIDVFVTDTLDPNLDVSTLEILTPGGAFDPDTRTVTWSFLGRNLEPGEGMAVLLAIRPMPDLTESTVIRNEAEIRFEALAPESTNEVVLTVDRTAPISRMDPLPDSWPADRDLELSWTANDGFGEVDYYTVYWSVDDAPYVPLISRTRETTATLPVDAGRTYCFYVVATDSAGNVEVKEPTDEACTVAVAVASGFRRGDADTSGAVNITDAIRILNVLFLGIGTISCNDAADADDSGNVNLTDAIRVMNVLFLGIGDIPAPAPEVCGPDPTDDPLGCSAYALETCN